MKITVEGTPKEVKELLQADSSKEQLISISNTSKNVSPKYFPKKSLKSHLQKQLGMGF